MIAVTGATGHLGRLVIEQLLARVAPNEIAALVRDTGKADDFAKRGIDVRHADYDQPETLRDALRGIDKVLLISASEVGKRIAQHRNVIDAARTAGARLIAYTSILRADRSGIGLAQEHLATENLIRESGIPFVFLRNGWYIENYTEHLGPALQYGVINGCAGDGRIAAATRADYATAAATVMTSAGHEGEIYELAGDHPFTMSDLAHEVSRAANKTIVYKDLPPDEYKAILTGAGFPAAVADLFVDWDLGVRRGDLDSNRDDLRTLIGRPTTPLARVVDAALSVD